MNILKRMNLPNRLTLLRVAMVPVFCAFAGVPETWAQIAAACVFVLASLTDTLDGRIARRRGLITDFGKLMDPIADKLLVTAAMVFLTSQQRMSAWACTLFVGREFVVSGFRLVAAARNVVIAAGKLGKYKTAAQMVAVVLSLLCVPLDGAGAAIAWRPLEIAAHAIMYAALALSILSGAEYIKKNAGVIDTRDI